MLNTFNMFINVIYVLRDLDYHYPNTYIGDMTDSSPRIYMIGGTNTPTSSGGYPLTTLNGFFTNFNGLTAGWPGDQDRCSPYDYSST